LAAKSVPAPFDHGEPRAHHVVPRHEQRTFEIAVPQQFEAALELGDLFR
jgi:hypothetical protein